MTEAAVESAALALVLALELALEVLAGSTVVATDVMGAVVVE